MTEVKHTPGPWVVGWGDGLTGPTTPNDPVVAGRSWECVPVSQGMETIAIVPNQATGYFSLDEAKGTGRANARLIAAAPDLLEALRELYLDLVANDQDGLIEHVEPMRKARAAIAKAEGRE